MSDLIQIPAPKGSPSSRPLEALFRAQLRLERWQHRRRWTAGLIIGLSLPMAYLVWSVTGLAPAGPRLVFLAWAFAFAGWWCTNAAVAVARDSVEKLVTAAGGRHVGTGADQERDAKS